MRSAPYRFPEWLLNLSFFLYAAAFVLLFFAIIALPAAAFVWLRGKPPFSPDATLIVAFLSNVVAATVIFWFVKGIVPSGLPSGSFLTTFDSVLWSKPASSDVGPEISAREKMLGDLVTNVLPGKTREQIEQLLGPSLDTPYFRSADKDMIYYLGRQRGAGINIDSEWLLIWLDGNGQFERYAIYND